MHAPGLLLYFPAMIFYLIIFVILSFSPFLSMAFPSSLFRIEEERRISQKTVCIFSELSVYDSFRITGDTVGWRTGDCSEPRLCFDLLTVNMGILMCLRASIRLDDVKRAALDGVKALSGMGGLGTGYARSFRQRRKREKQEKRKGESELGDSARSEYMEG
jgi:hypothetical protein